MQSRAPVVLGSLFLAAALWGCGGGGGSTAGVKPVRCSIPGASFCVTTCNLGCTAVGCGITDIAQNQPISVEFSQDVDPASLNSASFSLKSRTGESPAGRYLVQGRTITFDPDIRFSSGVTTFGFRANETYILTLAGGPNETQALVSTAGDPLGATLSCTLNVSRGVVDLDGLPPTGTLISPAQVCGGAEPSGVPASVTIVVEFSEIIDPSPFLGATTATSPIRYRLRCTRGGIPCDPGQAPFDLGGSPQAIVDPVAKTTQVLLKPAIALPSLACVDVEITTDVRDLSGRSAVPCTFRFTAAPASSSAIEVAETFATEAQLDRPYSSGTWAGTATPGRLGGDGRFGDFDITAGQLIGGVYVWSTDNQQVANVLTGATDTVTDGRFYFSRFEVPAGATLRWVGSVPPQIFVRGEAEVAGTIELNGVDLPPHNPQVAPTGQSGGAGAPGGGMGGKGADQGDGVSNQSRFNGASGEDVRLVAGHAYAARAVGTGGQGSHQYPVDGKNSSVTFNGEFSFCAQISAGGGGGGFNEAGKDGSVVRTSNNTGEHGPPGIGGILFNLLPGPVAASSLDHFLVGGSGGGGGGSHPYFASQGLPVAWRSGAGGTGGGGALALRCGADLTLEATGLIEALGGAGFIGTSPGNPPPGAGGAGSGGAVLAQAERSVTVRGMVNVSGGIGGGWVENGFYKVEHHGGDGAPGLVRVETVNTANASVPPAQIVPSTSLSLAALQSTEMDKVVGCQSKFYNTRQICTPSYLRYELQVNEDGVDLVYSDDAAWVSPSGFPNVGIAKGSTPVRLFVQGAQVQVASGQVITGSIRPWRQYVGPFAPAGETSLDDDDVNAYRFLLVFDRTVKQTLRAKKFTVYFRT